MNCIIRDKQPTPEQERKQHEAGIRSNDKRLKYADRLFALSLHENLGFGRERILEVSHAGYEIGRGYIERHTDEGEEAVEYAVNSYYALARDLRGWGWDPERELWNDDVFASFPWDKNTASVRRMWADRLEYAKGISFYARQMLCMGAMHLREKRGFADIRLERVYAPVRDGYLAMMREYMRCSYDGDRRMEAMFADVRKRYNALGYFETDYN